jgi:GMP synthase-like glutamine amidotransferase
MNIGIVSMYPHIKNINYLENIIRQIGYTPYVLDLAHSTPDKIYYLIKRSYIKHWIFSGSPLSVVDNKSIQIPMDIFNLKHKKYMFICYSLESIMYQLKYPISIRHELKKEYFKLDIDEMIINNNKINYLFEDIILPMNVWRNHYGYVSSHLELEPTEIASYGDECMILLYKNSILLQFHPEKTNDGLQLIKNWIKV